MGTSSRTCLRKKFRSLAARARCVASGWFVSLVGRKSVGILPPTPLLTMKPLPLFLALLLAGTTLPSRAVVVTLDAARDNTIFSDTFTQLSYGQGPYFYAGRNANDSVRRALFQLI